MLRAYDNKEQKDNLLNLFNPNKEPSKRAMFVLDMDGNINIGYNFTNPEDPLNVHSKSNAHLLEARRKEWMPLDIERIGIPPGTDVETLVKEGRLRKGIFADKGLDARLPKNLVDTLNRAIEDGDNFSITFLTSRAFHEALFILKESGVKHPERVTLVADSGAELQINGKRESVIKLNDTERNFLEKIHQICAESNAEISAMPEVKARLQELQKDFLPLTVEATKIAARNIHFRETFGALGLKESDDLAQRIEHVVQSKMQTHVSRQDAPVNPETGKKVFVMIPGTLTFEIKAAEATKDKGLKAIIEAAVKSGRYPDDIIFSGDDAFKWKKDTEGNIVQDQGNFGTDYPAAMYVEYKIGADFPGIKGHFVFTHHPERSDLTPATSEEDVFKSSVPDRMRAIPSDHSLHPVKRDGVALIVRTPVENADFIVSAVSRSLGLHEEAGKPKPEVIMTQLMAQHSTPEAARSRG